MYNFQWKRQLSDILDEFQDILNLKAPQEAIALLRSKIQFQPNIPYLFVGSIRHKMNEIFSHHDSPFFKSAIPISIDPIPYDEFSKFLIDKFTDGQRIVRAETLIKIFKIAYDIPGDIQQFCEVLWNVSSEGEIIGKEQINEGLELIFSREQKSYENYVSLLTYIQQKALRAIALEGGKNVFSVTFLKSAGFNNPSSVRKAITRMIELNILYESGGEYKYINPFFRVWLLYRG
ncbi:hypothetical protein ACFL0M_01410 [Thermodesulfobacteriota bacterium]